MRRHRPQPGRDEVEHAGSEVGRHDLEVEGIDGSITVDVVRLADQLSAAASEPYCFSRDGSKLYIAVEGKSLARRQFAYPDKPVTP